MVLINIQFSLGCESVAHGLERVKCSQKWKNNSVEICKHLHRDVCRGSEGERKCGCKIIGKSFTKYIGFNSLVKQMSMSYMEVKPQEEEVDC